MEFIRKKIRLPAAQYLGRKQYFLTLACEQRRAFFGSLRVVGWVIDELKDQVGSSRFLLHAWTIMPDHLHVLLEGSDGECDLLRFVTQFKGRTAKRVRIALDLRLWQSRFYDHILRPTDSFYGVAAYIWMNPVRKGICKRPEEYPGSGSLTLQWKQYVLTYPGWHPPWK